MATHHSVLDEARGLERLVDDLLLLARLDANTAPVDPRPVDLDDVVVRSVRPLRDDGRVTIDTTGVSGAQVLGDERQLSRAVGNVVANAVRHAATSIRITVLERDDVAVITIADDGPGIPPAERERVFERFARVDDARSASHGGTGLGLAITRDIVERHGGTVIMLDNGPGTTVELRLRLPR